VNVERRFIQ